MVGVRRLCLLALGACALAHAHRSSVADATAVPSSSAAMPAQDIGARRVAAASDAPYASRAAAATPTLAARADDNNDDTLPAGGLTVTKPPQNAGESYYKIAPHVSVTFGWSYTSLKTTPSQLFVVASCSQNGYTYPIAPSPSGIPGTATDVTWYPYGYHMSAQGNGQPDLAAAKYRLLIYDEQGPSAAAKGGRFAPNNGVEFAMYYPQAYTPLSEWTCGSCNGASSLSPRSSALVAWAMTLLTGVLAALALWPA